MDSPNNAQVIALLRALPAAINAAVLNAVREYTGNPLEGGGVVAASREGIINKHFTRGNKDRYGWKPLNPEYAAWKVEHFGTKPILVASGTMKSSIVGRAVVRQVAPGRIVVSWPQAVKYADYHHKGEGVPKRSPVEPNAADLEEIRKAARKHMQAMMMRLGAKYGVAVRVTG